MAKSPFASMMKQVRDEALRDQGRTDPATPPPAEPLPASKQDQPAPMVPHEVLQRARADMERLVAGWSGTDAIPTDAVADLRRRAVEIRLLERASHFAVFHAGKILTEVKASLQHGQFQDWLHNACGMHQRSASRYMSAYRTFEQASRVSHLPMRLIYRVGTARLPDADKRALADAVCDLKDPKQAAALVDERLQSQRRRRSRRRPAHGPAHEPQTAHRPPLSLPPGVQRAYDLIAALEDLAQGDLSSIAPVLLEHLEDLRGDIAAFLGAQSRTAEDQASSPPAAMPV